jgi:hypothetical protein
MKKGCVPSLVLLVAFASSGPAAHAAKAKPVAPASRTAHPAAVPDTGRRLPNRVARDVPGNSAASGSPAAVLNSTPAPGPDADVETVESADVTPVTTDGVETSADTATWYGEAWPMFDRVIDAYTGRVSRKGTFNTLISHRNNGGFARAPFDSLFGFDAGLLKIGLGLRYGIIDGLDAGVFRMNGTYEIFDTYEFDLRYQFFKQDKFGIDMALRAGFSWFASPGDNKDSAAPFISLLLDRVIANRVLVGFSILYHQNSSGPRKNSQDSSASMGLQLYTDVRLTEGLALALEFTQPLAGYHEFNPNVTFGPRFITNRHTFAIVLSNTQYYDADGIVTGNSRTSIRDWVLGFNITREL